MASRADPKATHRPHNIPSHEPAGRKRAKQKMGIGHGLPRQSARSVLLQLVLAYRPRPARPGQVGDPSAQEPPLSGLSAYHSGANPPQSRPAASRMPFDVPDLSVRAAQSPRVGITSHGAGHDLWV